MACTSTTSIGAASEPDRSNSDRSRASHGPQSGDVELRRKHATDQVATLMTFSLVVSLSTF